MPKQISNGDLYDQLTRMRVELSAQANQNRAELKGDVLRLESKFDTLEAGRLTRAESNISSLQVREATLNTKVVALVFIISSVSSGIIYALAQRLAHG